MILVTGGVETYPDNESEQNLYLDRLAMLNWRKDAAMWNGNVIQADDTPGTKPKVATNRAPVSLAVGEILSAIAWPTDPS